MKVIYTLICQFILQNVLFSQETLKTPVSIVSEYSNFSKKYDYIDFNLWNDNLESLEVFDQNIKFDIDSTFMEQGVFEYLNGVILPLTIHGSVSTKIYDNLTVTVFHQRMVVLNLIIAERVVIRKQYGLLYSTEEYKMKCRDSFLEIDNALKCEHSNITVSNNNIRIDILSQDRFEVTVYNMQGQRVYFEELEKSIVINENNFYKNYPYFIFIKNLKTKELCSKKYIKF